MDYEEDFRTMCIILSLIELDSLILNIPFVSCELGLASIILLKRQACTWNLGRIHLRL